MDDFEKVLTVQYILEKEREELARMMREQTQDGRDPNAEEIAKQNSVVNDWLYRLERMRNGEGLDEPLEIDPKYQE